MSPPGYEATCCSTPLKTAMLGKLWLPYASPNKTVLLCRDYHRSKNWVRLCLTVLASDNTPRQQSFITIAVKFPQYLGIVRDHLSHHHPARLHVGGRRTGINSHTLHPAFSCYLFPSSGGRRGEKRETQRERE